MWPRWEKSFIGGQLRSSFADSADEWTVSNISSVRRFVIVANAILWAQKSAKLRSQTWTARGCVQGQDTGWSDSSYSSDQATEISSIMIWSIWVHKKKMGPMIFMKIMSMSNPGYKSDLALGDLREPTWIIILSGLSPHQKMMKSKTAIKDAGWWCHGIWDTTISWFRSRRSLFDS